MKSKLVKNLNSTSGSLNERGIATIEAALLLTIFVVFMTYCVGTFGVIHTGILNSISARAYSFETFRNRANLTYFKDFTENQTAGGTEQTVKYGVRAHGVASEKTTMQENKWNVTERTLAQGRESPERRQPSSDANNLSEKRRELGSANPVWIKTVYGICLNYECGEK